MSGELQRQVAELIANANDPALNQMPDWVARKVIRLVRAHDAIGPPEPVPYRDVTLSRPARDALAGGLEILDRSGAVVLGAEFMGALQQTVERWDANDATEEYLDRFEAEALDAGK